MSTKGAPSLHKFCLALLIAIGAFCAEPGQALAGYIQTNLVSDIPGLATITDSGLVNPWGVFPHRHEPFLDFGPRDKPDQPLVCDRPYDCDQGDGRQPADRQYRDPNIGGGPAQGPRPS